MSQSTEVVGGSTDGLLGIVTVAQMLNPLPEGNNMLGSIMLAGFSSALPSGNNKIGKVEIEDLKPILIKPQPRKAKKVDVATGVISIKGGAGVVYALNNLLLMDGTSEIWAGVYQSENGISCNNAINVKSVGDNAGYIIYE
jgi:hypothetical protein